MATHWSHGRHSALETRSSKQSMKESQNAAALDRRIPPSNGEIASRRAADASVCLRHHRKESQRRGLWLSLSYPSERQKNRRKRDSTIKQFPHFTGSWQIKGDSTFEKLVDLSDVQFYRTLFPSISGMHHLSQFLGNVSTCS